VWVSVCAGTARGDGLDGERFTPATSADGGFAIEQPTVPSHLGYGLGLFFNFADEPVVERSGGTVTTRPLDRALSTDLIASMGFFERVELGVHLPLHLVYDGDPYMTGASTLSASSGVGDLRFVPKVAIVRQGSLERHVVLSLAMPVALPTGDELALRGAGGVTVEPRILFGFYLGRLGLAFDAGYKWRSEHPRTLPWGDEITFALGPTYRATNKLTLRAELLAAKEVGVAMPGADLPLELLGGIDYAIGRHWDLYAGASLGITDGIGDPRVRAIVGLRYRHHVPPRQGFADSDGDGVLTRTTTASISLRIATATATTTAVRIPTTITTASPTRRTSVPRSPATPLTAAVRRTPTSASSRARSTSSARSSSRADRQRSTTTASRCSIRSRRRSTRTRRSGTSGSRGTPITSGRPTSTSG
jgi:hypothetical protein